MTMGTKALDSQAIKTWFKARLIPIGLAVALLGAVGLVLVFSKMSEEAAFEELIIAYDDETGFAPFFAAEEETTSTANSAAPDATPNPNTAHAVLGYAPDFLEIPSIRVEAPIVPIDHVEAELEGVSFRLWLAPRGYSVGWHSSSSLLGVGGNTVLNGHHNAYQKVFEHLIDVEEGDLVMVSSGDHHFQYVVTTKVIFPERWESFETRMENTVWIEPTADERITLVTCWPAATNTHRLIIVAEPYLEAQDPADSLQE